MATFFAKYPVGVGTTSGTQNVQGIGTAGTQSGGVLTVQGDPSGTAIPVTTSTANRTKANAPVTNDYTSTAVTTAAYVQLVASTTTALTRLYIQDTSGSFMIIATGGVGVETAQFYYGPGFASFVDIAIPQATRIAIKALDTNATTGRLIMDFFT